MPIYLSRLRENTCWKKTWNSALLLRALDLEARKFMHVGICLPTYLLVGIQGSCRGKI